MLEFAFVLPILMFVLLFIVDMGHLMLMSGAMQDATFSAARTGAQVGGAAIDANGTGRIVCGGDGANGNPCRAGSTYRSLLDTAQQIPGYGSLGSMREMTVVHGAVCRDDGTNDHVELRTTYRTSLVTPGLGAMLNLMSPGANSSADGEWTLSATAVARCEVIRS